MPKRRDIMKLPVLLAPAAMFAAKAPGLQNVTLSEAQAKVTKEPFGDLKNTSRVYTTAKKIRLSICRRKRASVFCRCS